ncbi:DMT family transporter [Acidimangrovimonas sediminis]|uniref:DMT family transporter n=1 Tax=Acidimangrovimonas sediminis TaxID=2056283 RepID=UPI0018EE3FB7|nr:DMT family transporter [Acidimangrovimonas sediminis]
MSERRGLIAAALTGVQVGAALVATRYVAADLGPATLASLRYAVGLFVLVPFALRSRRVGFRLADLVPVLGLGIAQFGLLVALLNWGLVRIPASRGALIFATFPLLTMVLAAVLGRETMSWRKTLGTLLSIAGVALTLEGGLIAAGIGASDGTSAVGAAGLAGGLAILAAAITGAGCAVFYRPYLLRYPTLQVGTVAMAAAVVALVPFALAEAPVARLAALGPGAIAVVGFIGLSSGAGYVLWLTALRHTTPTRATVLLGLSPVTAAILGVLLLHERPGATLWAGLAAVLAGAVLAAREAPRKAGRMAGQMAVQDPLAIDRAGR